MKKMILTVVMVVTVIFLLISCSNTAVLNEKVEQAFNLLEEKEYDEAQNMFEEMIQADPSFTNAYIGLSDVYLQQNRTDEIIDILKQGYKYAGNIALDNQILFVSDLKYEQLLNEGKTCIDNKDYTKAIDILSQAISMIPESGKAYVLRGNSYLLSGNAFLDQSLQDYRSALALDDSDAEAVLGISEVSIIQGEYEEAEAILRAFLEKYDNLSIREKLENIENGYYYDYLGKIRCRNYYDSDDMINRNFLWRYEYVRNEDGKAIKVLHYDENYQLKEYIDILYDENGNTIQTYWSKLNNGDLIKSIVQYDEENRETVAFNYYDINAEKDNYDCYVLNEYDSNGCLIKETTYSPNGTIWWIYLFEYDNAGRETKHTCYLANGSISHYLITNYDDSGNIVSEITYDGNGNIITYVQFDHEDPLGTLVLELKEVKKSSSIDGSNGIKNNLCDLGINVTNGMELYVHTVVLNDTDDNSYTYDESKNANNVVVTLEYPECVNPKSNKQEYLFDTIELGSTSGIVEKLDYKCQNERCESFGNYVIEKEQTLNLTTKKCPNKHIVKATAVAEGFHDASDTIILKVDDDYYDYHFDNLEVKGTLNIGDNCSVCVNNFSLKDDWFFQKNSKLIMGYNSSLIINGKCTITPNAQLYINAGTFDVYGDCEIKNCKFSQDTNVIMHSYDNRHRKLKLRDAVLSKMTIFGGFLGVEFDVNLKNSYIDKLYYTKTDLYSEVKRIDEETFNLLNRYIEINNNLGTKEQTSMNLFSLTRMKGNSDQTTVNKIEKAIEKWFLEYNAPLDKIKDWGDVFYTMTPPQNAEIDGVKITTAGGMKLDAAAFGYAEYNGTQYMFAPNKEGAEALIKSYNSQLNTFAYGYVKSEMKKAISKDTKLIGGKIFSGAMEIFTNFTFALADDDWEDFFKSTLKVASKEAKTLAKQCKKLDKYYELIELFVDGKDAVRSVYEKTDGFYVNTLENIIDNQKAIYKLM